MGRSNFRNNSQELLRTRFVNPLIEGDFIRPAGGLQYDLGSAPRTFRRGTHDDAHRDFLFTKVVAEQLCIILTAIVERSIKVSETRVVAA